MPAAFSAARSAAGNGLQILAGADQQDLDLAGLGQQPVEIRRRQRQRIGRLPAMDAGRQAQKRAAMRHVGEAEPAIAIGLDRRAAGEMRLADDDAFAGHRVSPLRAARQVATALPPLTGFSSSAVAACGRSLNRISSGAAMKIDE